MYKNLKNVANERQEWEKKSNYIREVYSQLDNKNKNMLRKEIVMRYDIAENTLWQKLSGNYPFKRAEIEVIANLIEQHVINNDFK